MATKEEKIKALEQKQAQIKARIQALKARDTTQNRKGDDRRKILIGGVILKMIKTGEMQESRLNQILEKHLTAARDRAIFGLSPLAAPAALSPAAPSGGAVSE